MIDDVEADVLAVHLERDLHHRDVDKRSVLPHPAGSPLAAAGLECVVPDLACLTLELLGHHDLVDGATDHLVRRVAEQLGCGRVPAGHPFLDVRDHDGDGADRDERLEELLLPADLSHAPGCSPGM